MKIHNLKYYTIIISIVNRMHVVCGESRPTSTTTTVANSWITILSVASGYLVNCSSENTLIPWQCIRNGSIEIFDQITDCDVIPLMDNMRLRRYRQTKINLIPKDVVDVNRKKDVSFQPTWAERQTNKVATATQVHNPTTSRDTSLTWSQYILNGIVRTIDTHALEIDLRSSVSGGDEARMRRRHQMLPMMIFGVTAFGFVLVPMGFQFLAVMAGKALLLAKMALLLSSINGLKRVATSGVHYGFYQTPGSYGGQWDRMGQLDSGPR